MAPRFSEAVRVFARIGILSFGGPAAQIALMHRELVDERGWLDEDTYLRALSFCMLLPGPEAMQLATYAGWRLHGVRGGLMAGLLFVLPGAALILALAATYAYLGAVPLVQALFLGVKAAVLAIVIEALGKVARRALVGPAHWCAAGLSFLAIFALDLPFPLIIAAAALWGSFATTDTRSKDVPLPHPGGTLKTILVWLVLWLGPVALLWAMDARFLAEIAIFFSKLAVVTFGGAYAVLAYMTQDVVNNSGWLTLPEMMDALGLAETTPGPLILVTEFVGFLAGFREAGPGLAVGAALVTLWVTFCPCFLWIFAGAPYLDWISSRPRLTGALSGIIAAVVGVILNLSLWFGTHVIFGEVGRAGFGPVEILAPVIESIDLVALGLSAAATVALVKLHWPVLRVLLSAAAVTGGLHLIA